MEGYDPKKAAQVWQRVQGTALPDPEDNGLLGLIAGELAASALYLALSKRYTGKENARLRTMAEEAAAHGACLKGMYFLRTGQKAQVQTVPPGQEPMDAALRRCYAGELRSIRAYEARSDQPEYGHIFAGMAQDAHRHSRTILELLGK